MPGVVVNTAVRSAPTTANVSPASTFFVSGTAVRGPLDEAVFVNSLADFEATFGVYDASYTLHQQVQTFFEEGGAQAYVVRVSNADTAGSLVLNDGSAASALTINAANNGAWSDNVDIAVDESGGTFVITVYYEDELVYTSTSLATAAAAATEINNSAVATLYISATATVGNTSAVLTSASATALAGGGGDANAIADGDFVDSLELFDIAYGAGVVAVPGENSTTVRDGLIAHGVANNRIAALAVDNAVAGGNDTLAEATADVSAVVGADDSEYATILFPYVTIPGEGGVTLEISPEGYYAAKRAKAVNASGPWQAAAGVTSKAEFVNGVAVAVNQTLGNSLDEANINAIRVIQNTVRIYGARSASTDTSNFRYITARDTLNYISSEATRTLEDLVFSTIDGRRSVFGRVEARLIAILEPMRSAGGLYEGFAADGRQIDPGYSVEVSDALNPTSSLADGVVRAKVGVRVSSTGDRIVVDVIKSNLTSSVV